MLMVGGGGPELAWRGESKPQAFHYLRAGLRRDLQARLAAGATSIAEPTDQSYGERSAQRAGCGGQFLVYRHFKSGNYKWEGAPDIQPNLHPLRSEPVINFLKRAFDAEEVGPLHATPDGVVHHATMKVGDSYLELGDAHGHYQPMEGMFYLYVPNCDDVYRRALAAGGKSIAMNRQTILTAIAAAR